MIITNSLVAHLAATGDKIPDDMVIPDGYMLMPIKEYVTLKGGGCPDCDAKRKARSASQRKWRDKKKGKR